MGGTTFAGGKETGIVPNKERKTKKMKKFVNMVAVMALFVLCAVATSTSASAAEYVPATYTDITGDEWFADEVSVDTQLGIFEGFEDGSFRPQEIVSQAEALTSLYRASEYFVHGQIKAGADNSTWYASAVSGMEEAGMVNFEFTAGADMARADVAFVAASYLGYEAVDADMVTLANGIYSDLQGLTAEQISATGACAAEEVMIGVQKGSFGVKGLTRAELAVVIYRMLTAQGVVSDDGSIIIEDPDVPMSGDPEPSEPSIPSKPTISTGVVDTIGTVTEITGEVENVEIIVVPSVGDDDESDDETGTVISGEITEIVIIPDEVVEAVTVPGDTITGITETVEISGVTETVEVAATEIASTEMVGEVTEVILVTAPVATVAPCGDVLNP